MSDTAALKIINLNIDSIQAVKEECNTNIGNARESNTTQKVHMVEKSCTNTGAIQNLITMSTAIMITIM